MTAVSPLRTPRSHRRISCALFITVLALTGATPHRLPAAPPAMPPPDEIAAQLREVLPERWSIRQTTAHALPPGWQGMSSTAVIVQVGDGQALRTISFVPLDWIGVQTRGNTIEPVRYGETSKVILSGGATEVPAWLDRLAPHPASLASPTGTTRFFAGEYLTAASQVRALIRKGGAARELAVASFIALGVPAEDPIREAALDPRHPARHAAIRSLHHFPGRATREALLKILAERARDANTGQARLAALDACHELMIDGHGPAVLAGLQVEKDEATALRLVDEINTLRLTAAAPELRRRLKAASSLQSKAKIARALATLRDPAAAAEIQTALAAPASRRAAVAQTTDALARRRIQEELHRLTGTWGAAVRGVRMSLVTESPDRIIVHVENMAREPFLYIPVATGTGQSWPVGLEVQLDGEAISPPGPRDAELGRLAEIARQIEPGTSQSFELLLPARLPAGGELLLTARWFELAANEVVLRASTPATPQAPPAS